MADSKFSLDERVALVTGASRGLGFAMAKALAEAGATVVLNGREARTLEEKADDIRADGWQAETAAFDVTDHAAVAVAIQDIKKRHGGLDILVANAGIQHRRPLTEFATEDFQRVVDTNLTAVWVLAREAARIMLPQKMGRIIITSSISALAARPTISAYIASKGAVTALTRALAVELGPQGITVNAIAPGYIATEMNSALLENKDFTDWVSKRTPAGRWGQPSDLGGAVVFLASDAAAYVNGVLLPVDGGFTASM
jgi:gluconate 5-dehydrogenase